MSEQAIYWTGTDEIGTRRSGHTPAAGFPAVAAMRYRQGWTTLTTRRDGADTPVITTGKHGDRALRTQTR
jgi:hypothetical protein